MSSRSLLGSGGFSVFTAGNGHEARKTQLLMQNGFKHPTQRIQAVPKSRHSSCVPCGLFYLGKGPGHTLQHAFVTVLFDWQMPSNKMHISVLIRIPCPKPTWQICDFDSISFCWLRCSVIAGATWLPHYAYHQSCSLKWPQFTSFGSSERTWNELLSNKEAAVMQNKRQAKESFGLMRLSECLPCITSYLTAFEHGFFLSTGQNLWSIILCLCTLRLIYILICCTWRKKISH